MAVAYGTTGTVAYSAGNPAPTYPASIAAGDLLILAVGTKPSATPATTPSGWTNLAAATGDGGTGSTGIDTGPMRVGIFYKIADGTETGTLTVTVTGNNVSAINIYRFTNATGAWDIAGALGDDTTTGTPFTATASSNPGITSGDHVLTVGVIPTDVTTPAQFSAETLVATGATFSAVTEIEEWDTALGQDMGGVICRWNCTAGTASAAPVFSATAGGTTTNVAGPIAFIRVREAPAVYPRPVRNINREAIHRSARW